VAEPVLIARFRQITDRLAPPRVTPMPHTRETLERISSLAIPMAVLCNGWSRIARREAERAGFTGPVIASKDIGVAKPARRAFDRLVETLGLPAGCVWYVGNHPYRDVDGAVNAGLTAVSFNPEGAPYPADIEPPALTIRSLDELLPPVCEISSLRCGPPIRRSHPACGWERVGASIDGKTEVRIVDVHRGVLVAERATSRDRCRRCRRRESTRLRWMRATRSRRSTCDSLTARRARYLSRRVVTVLPRAVGQFCSAR
jgi:hypothetical protein